MSTSASPCAACKFLRRKCTQECVFAPYFPPDQPLKFANVHKVFGASNVAKILMELNPNERADTVISLAYEAEARLKDPVYGCVGTISILQHRLKHIQTLLQTSKHELATYVGPSAMMPMLNPQPGILQMYSNGLPYNGPVRPVNVQPMLSLQGAGTAPDEHQQQMLFEASNEKNQLVDAARELELLRNFQQQQQQPVSQQSGDLRFNAGFDSAGPSRQVDPSQFTQLRGPAVGISPALALGGSYDNNMHENQQQHFQQQLLMAAPPQFQPPPHHGDGGGSGRSRNVGSN